jgi:hypothetical protein
MPNSNSFANLLIDPIYSSTINKSHFWNSFKWSHRIF